MRLVSWFAAVLLTVGRAHAETPELRDLSPKELPPYARAPGELMRAVGFRDATGEHAAVFWRRIDASTGNARLQVDLWSAKPDMAKKLVRSVKDGVSGCELDLVAEFVDRAIAVTDLDADGAAELTFAYRTTCAGDVSPLTLKLFVLEGQAKYVLRGTTRVDVGGGERVGGDRKPDPALRKNPAFRAHAERVWKKIVGA